MNARYTGFPSLTFAISVKSATPELTAVLLGTLGSVNLLVISVQTVGPAAITVEESIIYPADGVTKLFDINTRKVFCCVVESVEPCVSLDLKDMVQELLDKKVLPEEKTIDAINTNHVANLYNQGGSHD